MISLQVLTMSDRGVTDNGTRKRQKKKKEKKIMLSFLDEGEILTFRAGDLEILGQYLYKIKFRDTGLYIRSRRTIIVV